MNVASNSVLEQERTGRIAFSSILRPASSACARPIQAIAPGPAISLLRSVVPRAQWVTGHGVHETLSTRPPRRKRV